MKLARLFFFFVIGILFIQCKNPTPYGDLYVQVRDEQGNAVVDGVVTLYGSLIDFENQTNKLLPPSKTDENGLAFFLNLSAGTYYIAAEYEDKETGNKKNNFLVDTEINVVSTEIGYRNSITVIIWDSFLSNLTSSTGKQWEINRIVDVQSGDTVAIEECLKDDLMVFYTNGVFEYISTDINCNEEIDDNFTGNFAPVSNGSFIVITDELGKTRYGLYIISVTSSQMITHYGDNFIYYNNVL
ncbi:carboxypeptidase regulatory-like domain-containing protein [Flammeovirga pectinis]|uniref:Carboxypeptidase regulatory-like domain-containing protein n=1 Tax=Flammeovirga pectinis TaxID=2494373 RepID=A0A3S9NZW7_9BACT|nr:carboxypeptidase-like regulatory domain-containing protein [Flammeovirga pectinis]AZQ61473.1 carboxypeptidase regulatory-like domain-containing protein [Flammeovirga pectinis]